MRTICLATPIEAPDRYAAAQRHFTEIGLEVEYCYGLHKDTSGLTTDHLYMVDRPFGSPEADIPYSIGKHPTNIWLGHYMIWNALRLSGDKCWFVVECDAKFPPDWARHFAHAMDTVPRDYDLVYMGSCCTRGRRKELVPNTTNLYRMFGTAPQCNHAYVVTAAAAEIMCSTLRKVWAPVDVQQASECWGDPLPRAVEMVQPRSRELVVYTVLPRIVEQWNMELPE